MCATNVFAGEPPEIEWFKIYETTELDWGTYVIETTDNYYLVSIIKPNDNMVAMKLDTNGNIMWNTTVENFYPMFIFETTSGDYLIQGHNGIVKLSKHGDFIFKTSFDDTISYGKGSITSDGGLIISGSFLENGIRKVSLLKVSSSGEIVLEKNYGANGNSIGYSAIETNGGGYIATGFMNGEYNNDLDWMAREAYNAKLFLMKTDSEGNLIWNKTYGDKGSYAGTCVIETNDDGYLVGGFSDKLNSGDFDLWLVKTDGSGNEVWNYTYDFQGWSNIGYGVGNAYVSLVYQLEDNGYVFSTYPLGSPSIYKVNKNGILEWEYYNSTIQAFRFGFEPTSDKGFIIATNLLGNLWLGKLGSGIPGIDNNQVNDEPEDNTNEEDLNDDDLTGSDNSDTPGFEAISVIFITLLILIFKRK